MPEAEARTLIWRWVLVGLETTIDPDAGLLPKGRGSGRPNLTSSSHAPIDSIQTEIALELICIQNVYLELRSPWPVEVATRASALAGPIVIIVAVTALRRVPYRVIGVQFYSIMAAISQGLAAIGGAMTRKRGQHPARSGSGRAPAPAERGCRPGLGKGAARQHHFF